MTYDDVAVQTEGRDRQHGGGHRHTYSDVTILSDSHTHGFYSQPLVIRKCLNRFFLHLS